MNGQMQMRLIGIPNGPVVRWAMSAAMAALGVVFSLSSVSAAEASAPLLVGEGVVDISPPLGTALGGFHYSDPTRPRVATAIHYPPEVRALVLSRSKVSMAIISFDMLNVSFAMVRDVQTRIKSQLGIPATHVRICATHAHSMPSIAFNRHWGDNNPEYEETVARAMVKAVKLALKDQATTRLFAGTARAVGAIVNRTVRSGARSDAEFTAESTEKDRWVDASLHVLHFERGGGKGNLLWYNFAAHPTTYGGSGAAGPGWPGVVQKRLRAAFGVSASYLQGHIGDISPTGRERTATLVTSAIVDAVASAREVPVDVLSVETQSVALPFDLETFRKNIAQHKDSSLFDRDWFRTFASRYDFKKKTLAITLAAVRLGDVALAFHPAELYTVYGLELQRDSPFQKPLVVGYADGYVGYVPDKNAYLRKEYAAAKVPRILNYPPIQPDVGTVLSVAARALLRRSHQ